MCDPSNTCTLAEGLDFTSAFISTHELGHSVGMRHDEPCRFFKVSNLIQFIFQTARPRSLCLLHLVREKLLGLRALYATIIHSCNDLSKF